MEPTFVEIYTVSLLPQNFCLVSLSLVWIMSYSTVSSLTSFQSLLRHQLTVYSTKHKAPCSSLVAIHSLFPFTVS